jgi:lipopolysaccharide export system protein LptA
MRATLLAAVVFGFAVTAGGQTQPPVQTVRITATNVERAADLVQYRGNVQMTIGAATVSADEVDLPTTRHNPDGSPSQIQIRGNVQVAFDTATPILIQT